MAVFRTASPLKHDLNRDNPERCRADRLRGVYHVFTQSRANPTERLAAATSVLRTGTCRSHTSCSTARKQTKPCTGACFHQTPSAKIRDTSLCPPLRLIAVAQQDLLAISVPARRRSAMRKS